MSRATINQLLGLAIADPDFCRLLLASPVEAAQQQGIDLTLVEKKILLTIVAHDLQEFCQQLLAKSDLFL